MMSALAGLMAGALHVVSGPDHIAAIAPAASRAPGKAAGLGATWGLGHGAGVLVCALLARALSDLVALDALSRWAELAVGLALIAIGGRAMRARGTDSKPDRRRSASGGAFSIGVVHGVAGAHHLLLLLPALVMTRLQVTLYLGAYLLAAVATMAAAGVVVARGLRGRSPHTRRRASILAGAVAVAIGLYWLASFSVA